MITEDYVSFEVAKLLKEKGFDEATHKFYKSITYLGTEASSICIKSLNGIENEPFHNSVYGVDLNGEDTGEYACPTLQMAMKWLREEHNLFIEISVDEMLRDNGYQWALYDNNTKKIIPFSGWGNSYEEACESAIKYCLENLI